ncbi:MAG: hypothetical protein AAF598_14500 [Bacteroidota bacterium]
MTLVPFREILQNHQSDQAYMALRTEFDRLGIYDVLELAIGKLELAVQNAKDQVLGPPISLISTISSNLLVSINHRLEAMEHLETKRTIQGHASSLAIKLLNNLVYQFPKNAVNILNTVHESLQTTAELFDFDKTHINHLLPIGQMAQLARTLSPVKGKNKNAPLPSLIWTDKVNIGLLTWALKDAGWIKKQQNFAKLFDSRNNELIQFNLYRKYELAYLLYSLRSHNYIGTSGNKGYFSIVEKRIVGFEEETLTPNALKKMSSKISRHPEKYRSVTESVAEILDQLQIV